MVRIAFTVAVCTVLTACGAGPTHKPSESVPPELVPAGFTVADCKVVKPTEADVDDGPGDNKYSHGEHGPKVECSHHSEGPLIVKSTPTCHTVGGKALPLADCCMTEAGAPIPACTPKTQPPGE